MTDRLPPVCTPQQIKAAYHAGLRIEWDQDGARTVWEVVAVDDTSATTRFTQPDGSLSEATATFDELSSHSAFPVGTELIREEFSTPLGSFDGTHVVAGDNHFYFADDLPGPPLIIDGPGSRNQQVARSDVP